MTTELKLVGVKYFIHQIVLNGQIKSNIYLNSRRAQVNVDHPPRLQIGKAIYLKTPLKVRDKKGWDKKSPYWSTLVCCDQLVGA